jgi:hypothetical protein
MPVIWKARIDSRARRCGSRLAVCAARSSRQCRWSSFLALLVEPMQYDRLIERTLRDAQGVLRANLPPAKNLPDKQAV